MNKLKENIKKFRKEKGYTLLEMSNKLGIAEATFQRYESGSIKNLKYDQIIKIAEIYGVTPQTLMGWDNVKEDEIISKYNLDEYELSEYKKIANMNMLMFDDKDISEEDRIVLEKTLKEIFIKSLLKKRAKEQKEKE